MGIDGLWNLTLKRLECHPCAANETHVQLFQLYAVQRILESHENYVKEVSHIKSGWWYTYPSEKYESQSGLLFPIYGKA